MYIIPLPVTVSPPVGVVCDIISGGFPLIMAVEGPTIISFGGVPGN